MENNIGKLKQLNIDTDAKKAFKPQFLKAVKRFGKMALVSSMLALNMACQQPTGPEPEPIPTPIEQPENPENTPTNPENTPEDPGNTPEDPGNTPEDPGNNPEDPGNTTEDPGNNPEDPGNNPGGDQPDNPNNGGEEETQIDQAVQNVISLIDALPNANDITAANKATVQAQIDAIEAAYAGLTAEQKQQVTNYSKVTAAQNKITAIENALNQQQNQFPEPTTTPLGNYTMYDFVQNNTIQYGSPLREMELNYLQKAEGYIQNNLNALSNSAKQNTTISNAINYYNQNAKKHYQEGTYTDIGAAHNKTTKAIAPVFQEIVKQLTYETGERDGFELCYRALANEVYQYGLGDYKSQSRPETNIYNNEKAYLLGEAEFFTEFCGIDIQQVYQNKNFTPILNQYNNYLTKAANKIDGVNEADLKAITNMAFITKSMQGLASLEKNAGLNVTQLASEIVNAIQHPSQVIYTTQQGNEMGM